MNDIKPLPLLDESSTTTSAVAAPEVATPEVATPEVAAKDEHKKRIPLVWIPATLSIGLLIAAIYLVSRIVTAHKPAPASIAAVAAPVQVKPLLNNEPPAAATISTSPQTPKPKENAEVANVPAEKVENQGDDAIPLITPHAGERYLQVGALDQEATRRFVQHLRNENLEPHVAPGPKPELMRVLIGPFDNHEALNEKKAQILNEGMETFVREY